MFTKGFRLFLTAVLLQVMICTHAIAANDSISRSGFFLDTVIDIKINGSSDETLLDNCFRLIGDYEKILSRTLEGSDIWKINHSNGDPVAVNEETADLISLALHYCEISEGRFDITIAPVVDLWDFHDDAAAALPEEELLQEALSHVDYHQVQIRGLEEPLYDEKNTRIYTVALGDPRAMIDLGGIAKGYIADQVRGYLLSEGITSALINLGGNVLTLGEKPDGSAFNIGIRRPFGSGGSDICAVVPIRNLSLVTSGNYERYFELDGQLYHHILDPATGYPSDSGVTSVTILCESSAEGDALSTTCFLLGAEKGLELIESMNGYEAMYIDNEGNFLATSGFPLTVSLS